MIGPGYQQLSPFRLLLGNVRIGDARSLRRAGWACALVLSMVACAGEQTQLKQPVGSSRLRPRPAMDAPSVLRTADEPSRAEPQPRATGAEVDLETRDRHLPPNGFSLCELPQHASDALLFSSDSKALRPRGKELMDQLAFCLLKGPLTGEAIAVRGYADPRGSDEYNMELSEDRAATVRRYLIRRGVDPERVVLVPVGEERARGYGPESWQLDRRVEIRLLAR